MFAQTGCNRSSLSVHQSTNSDNYECEVSLIVSTNGFILSRQVSQNRDLRGLPHSPGAYQYKYSGGFGTTSDQTQTDFQNRNTDSDYFSSNGSGSPRCDHTDVDAAAFNIENSSCIISRNNNNGNNSNNSLSRDQIGFNPQTG